MTPEDIQISKGVYLLAIERLRVFVKSQSEGRMWSPAQITFWLGTLDDLQRHVNLWVIEQQEKEER